MVSKYFSVETVTNGVLGIHSVAISISIHVVS